MKKIIATLATALLILGVSGSASALSIVPDPVNFSIGSGKKAIEGFIDFLSATPTQLELELTATKGSPFAIDILVLDSSLTDLREATDTGWTPGTGVDIVDDFIALDTAFFLFDKFGSGGKGGGGGSVSDPFFVEYSTDNLAVGDEIFIGILGSKGKGGFDQLGVVTATIVPEPATAILLGLGVAGLAFMGRSAARRRAGN
jgi:hypothetical protein